MIHATSVVSRRQAIASVGLLLGSAAATRPTRAATREASIYRLDVSDVSAKVGAPAVMVVTLTLHDGYRILHAYSHHVSQLSSFDDGVSFARKWVTPDIDESGLVFKIDLRATSVGRHPINGVVRFGYIEGDAEFAMISVPLIAAVEGIA